MYVRHNYIREILISTLKMFTFITSSHKGKHINDLELIKQGEALVRLPHTVDVLLMTQA